MPNFTPAGVELVAKGARGFFGTLDKANSKIVSFGKTVAKSAVAGVAAFSAAAAGIGAASLKAAVDYESAFAGVIKTTDGLVDEFGNLTAAGEEISQEFRNLAKEVPTAVEELLAIGELGGQLGIARENLVDFTRTIAAMGEATNLTTEEAATGFAQLANIMGTPQDQIENMGSSIVALGNNFATTERDILNFAQRIAGAGQIAGLTEAQVFGIGAAFASVGVEAEAGGTAVQKVLLGMNQAVLEGGDALEIFAATAGRSADEFADLWEKDAGKAFDAFVQGLGDAGDDALGILTELDLKDQRLTRAFLSLAGAGDLLTESMELSTTAFEENTALSAEAEARYRTTAAQFDIFKNTIKDVGITIGQALLPFLNQLLQQAQPLIAELGQRLPEFLNNVLIPALQDFGAFVIGVVIPALADIFNWLGQNIPTAVQALSDLWANTLQPAIQTVTDFIQTNVIPIFEALVGWFQDNMPLIEETVGTVLTAIQDFWNKHGEAITNIAMSVWEAIKAIVNAAVAAVQGIIEFALNVINGNWDAAWQAIKNALFQIWEAMKTIVTSALEALKNLITIALDVLKTAFTTSWNLIKAVVSDVLDSVLEKVGLSFDGIVKTVNDALKAARTIVEFLLGGIRDIFSSIWEKITGIVRGAIDTVLGIINGVVGAMEAAGRAIVDAVKRGIEAAWQGLVNWFKSKLDGLVNMLPFSEPKDPSSPLRGLSRSGEAIVGNILRGLQEAMPALQTQLTAAITVPQLATAAGSSTVVNNTVNLTMNNQMGDGAGMAMFEARTLQTINKAIQTGM